MTVFKFELGNLKALEIGLKTGKALACATGEKNKANNQQDEKAIAA